MRALFYLFLLCFFTGSLFADGTISGMITNLSSGSPILGAQITALKGNNVIATTTSAANGTYSMTCNPGNYTIRASASAYQTSIVGAQVKNNQTITVNFSLLSNPGIISGTMRDAQTSLPLSGASVQILQNNILIASTTTNGSGNYSIANLAPASYVVTAQATSYQTNFTGAIVQSDRTTTIDLSLQPHPGILIGTIRDNNSGLPISGAVIEVRVSGVAIYNALTNREGEYSITEVAPRSYVIHAQSTNHQLGILGAIVQSNQATTVDFSLQPNPGAISGTVTASDTGLPIASSVIAALLDGVPTYSSLTDSDGNYTLPGVSPGSYTVLADADNYQSSAVGAIIQSGETSLVNFSLQPDPGAISGIVTDSNTSLPIASVSIQVIQNCVVVSTAVTDPLGTYNITGVAPGSYTVLATANNYQSNTSGAIVAANVTATVNFSLVSAPGAIAGTIISSFSGLPLGGVIVEVNSENAVLFSTLTNSMGQYDISGIPAGFYVLHVHATDYQTAMVGVNISTAKMVNFSLEPEPATVCGIITDANTGLPIASATVRIIFEGFIIYNALTDTSGNYSITGVAAGSYMIHAHATDYQIGTSLFTVTENESKTINFALLTGPSTLQGNVTSQSSGLPLANVLVDMYYNNLEIAFTHTDPSGNYIISGLPPGIYIAHAHFKGYQSALVEMPVSSDEIITPNFSLASNPSRVIGSVTDITTGLQISGVFINTLLNGLIFDTTLTDENGNYEQGGLPAGTYQMVTNKSGYASKTIDYTIDFEATKVIDIQLISLFSPPQNLVGKTINNRFALQTDRIHHLAWQASINPDTVCYRVYRNDVLIAVVSATKPLVYDDHNRIPRVVDTYKLTAVSVNGEESPGVFISLN